MEPKDFSNDDIVKCICINLFSQLFLMGLKSQRFCPVELPFVYKGIFWCHMVGCKEGWNIVASRSRCRGGRVFSLQSKENIE